MYFKTLETRASAGAFAHQIFHRSNAPWLRDKKSSESALITVTCCFGFPPRRHGSNNKNQQVGQVAGDVVHMVTPQLDEGQNGHQNDDTFWRAGGGYVMIKVVKMVLVPDGQDRQAANHLWTLGLNNAVGEEEESSGQQLCRRKYLDAEVKCQRSESCKLKRGVPNKVSLASAFAFFAE